MADSFEAVVDTSEYLSCKLPCLFVAKTHKPNLELICFLYLAKKNETHYGALDFPISAAIEDCTQAH